MANVNRPLLGVLAVTVVFFALWLVALKPSGGGNSGASTPALGRYGSDIAKAHGAVATSNRENAKISAAAGVTSTPAASAHTSGATRPTPAASTHTSAATRRTPATHARTPAHTTRATHLRTPRRAAAPASRGHAASHHLSGPAAVDAALQAGRPLALLFYNPAGADDRDVRAELLRLRLPARVLKLAVPIAQVARYTAISQQLAIDNAPTLVIVNHARDASTIVGYASAFEIRARIDAALAAGR